VRTDTRIGNVLKSASFVTDFFTAQAS